MRVVAQYFQVIEAVLTVNPQPVGVFRAQRVGLRQHRALIDVHQFYRYGWQVTQRLFRRIEPFT